jgi:S-phase kinase-associated protein 1
MKAKTKDDMKAWDLEFFQFDLDTLFELILAANYMDMPLLLDFGCRSVAEMIKDKPIEEIKQIFNITETAAEKEEKAE